MYPKLFHQNQWHNPMPNNQNNNGQGLSPPYCHGNVNLSHPSGNIEIRDYGQQPLVINIEQAAKYNQNYRTALWTGKHFQVTLMSIRVGEDIGLEVHPTTDQFIRIEEGKVRDLCKWETRKTN